MVLEMVLEPLPLPLPLPDPLPDPDPLPLPDPDPLPDPLPLPENEMDGVEDNDDWPETLNARPRRKTNAMTKRMVENCFSFDSKKEEN